MSGPQSGDAGSGEDELGTGYCTPAQVRAALSSDAAPGKGDVASIGLTSLVGAIQDAGNEIDSWVGNRYTVPFTAPIPGVVEGLAVAIATYLATLTFMGSVEIPATEPSVLRYQRAQTLLKAIAAGQATVPLDPDGPGPEEPSQARRRPRPGHNPYDGRLFGPEDFGLGVERSYDRRR